MPSQLDRSNFDLFNMSSIEELELIQARRRAAVGFAEFTAPPPLTKTPSPIDFSRLLARDGNKTIGVRTGFTEEEFDELYDILAQRQVQVKRGRKLMDLKTRLVVLLQWIYHGQTFEKLGKSMGLSHSCVQTSITSIWNDFTVAVFDNYVPKSPNEYKSTRSFINYPAAVGALDATLISINKPSEKEENRRYFSGKHKKHGAKLQILVAPDGTCIHYGGIIEGSRNDFYLFEQSTLTRDLSRREKGGAGGQLITRPQILADGGYLGIHHLYPEAIIPNRKPPHGKLTEEQKAANRLLSQDRSIVERFFGRMKGYWGILQRPYRCERDSLDSLAKIVVALTNLKIRTAPLFADEHLFNPDPSIKEEEDESEPSIGGILI